MAATVEPAESPERLSFAERCVTVLTALEDHLGRLVHPSASPVDGVRHRCFIATRIALSCGVLALVPLFLVTGGVPGWCDGLIFAWLTLPLLAAAHVSNTGQTTTGETISAAAWIGLALTALAGRACGFGAACVLLMVVPLEASLTASRRTGARLMAAAALALIAAIVIAVARDRSAGPVAHTEPVLMLFAFAHAAALVWQSRSVGQAREAAAQLDAQRYQVLSEAMGDLVLRFDRGGFVLAASGASERLFGIPSGELTGRGFFDRVHVADRPSFLHAVSQAANGCNARTVNVRLRLTGYAHDEGEFVEPVFAWVEIRTRRLGEEAALVKTSDASTVVAAVRDITMRVRHEAEIQKSKQEAVQANASKDRFIAVVSHELRTPLNAIIGFGEMLASPTLSPQDAGKRREYAEIIRSSGQHLLAVVNSLLDLSKLDAGKFELSCEPFAISELIDACCDMVRLKADQQGIAIGRDVDASLEPLTGDKRACKQIILNLLSNALKFTAPGGRVSVAARPDGNSIVISVLDTGIGMMPRDLAKLGDPFFQVRGDYDRPFEGTGLGLSVVKGLVGLHGGTITVESAPGEGTRIAVRLPLDGRRREATPASTAKIEVIARYPRSTPAGFEQKVQKIA